MTFANELKPPLEEALEHYGVKGMRWGVRRDQVALDRAAGRRIKKGTGKGRSTQIREARKSVASKQRKIYKTEDALEDADNPKARAAAKKNFEKALKEFDENPKRAVAAKVTLGEAAVVSLLLTPAVGLATVAAGEVISATVRTKQQRRKITG